MKLPLLSLSILACLAACGPPQSARQPTQAPRESPADFALVSGEAGPDDLGRFLAGLPVRHGAALSRLQQTTEYRAHHHEMDRLWRLVGSVRASRMRAWSERELARVVRGGGTVLYPFGGPDLLHVSAMFPRARTCVLIGLEPVGAVPALESSPPGEVFAALAAFRQATRTQLDAGYFITGDMRSDLQHGVLRGVTPVLLGTVALSGGRTESVSSMSAGGMPGVELRFRDAAGKRHNAIYVAGDLSNSGFTGGYRQWLSGLGGEVAYFKAASYLMHDNRFSQARDFFLSRCRVILQDDSGIPFRCFAQGWSLRFYGSYGRPIDLFTARQQEDLRQAYATNPAGPIDFGCGYHVKRWEGNLLLAVKR
jgi:hypothetical protein